MSSKTMTWLLADFRVGVACGRDARRNDSGHLLVKAVEETDPTHAPPPLADREQATRETLRELGLSTADFDTA